VEGEGEGYEHPLSILNGYVSYRCVITRILACNLPSINNDSTWDHFRRHPKHLSIKKQKQYVKKQTRRL